MPLAGVLLGPAVAASVMLPLQWLCLVMLAACGLFVLLGGFWQVTLRRQLTRSWALYTVPLLLSIDNLLAGVALSASQVPLVVSMALVGAITAPLAFAGLLLGGAVVRVLPLRRNVVSGAALILLSATSLLEVV